MATFRTSSCRDGSFSVEMTTAGGQLRTIPGFRSEHEAAAWIVQTERLTESLGLGDSIVKRFEMHTVHPASRARDRAIPLPTDQTAPRRDPAPPKQCGRGEVSQVPATFLHT
jgi:hypothetical protein